MREIKFRYVVKIIDRMKNGDPIREHTEVKVFSIEEIEDDSLDSWLRSEIGMGYGTCEVLARSQFTGTKDSDGREIYEGDIIRESHHAMTTEFDVFNCVVVFDSGSFIFDFCALNKGRLGSYSLRTRKPDAYRRHKVIGNIYENPELLK